MEKFVPTLRTMDDLMLDGKRVIVRVDFNVSAGADGIVDSTEDYRIESALETIHELRQRRCKVLLMTHLGRPGEEEGILNIDPIQRRLQQLIQEDVRILPKLYGPQVDAIVQGMEPGEVALYPNVRMDNREMVLNDRFADELASGGDVYINEAFSVSHRDHTSVSLLPKKLPSAAGRRTVLEVQLLSKLRNRAEHPYIAIASGAKISTKIGILEYLLSQVDMLCLGGKIANVFLVAQGKWKNTSFPEEEIAIAKKLLDMHSEKILLPIDVVAGDETGNNKHVIALDSDESISGPVWDIGPRSVEKIVEICKSANTIIWNGPVGKYEVPAYAEGTRAIAHALSGMQSNRIVGGGDTVTVLGSMNLISAFTHVSIGGGAMIEFLEGKTLPGLAVLYTSSYGKN
ncbi:MAG TPA: phosphoglycerate kinase [Candidatus Andersenbacteria bacterium]|nr:phosphoglycerate kinase [Candidatus Andersenbacteria bacterium]